MLTRHKFYIFAPIVLISEFLAFRHDESLICSDDHNRYLAIKQVLDILEKKLYKESLCLRDIPMPLSCEVVVTAHDAAEPRIDGLGVRLIQNRIVTFEHRPTEDTIIGTSKSNKAYRGLFFTEQQLDPTT